MKSGKLLSQRFLGLVLRSDSAQQANLLGTLLLAVRDCQTQLRQRSKKLLQLIDFLELNEGLPSDVAHLSIGLSQSENPVEVLVPDRLVFSTRGIPNKERVGFVSSRLGHSPDQNLNWFDAVRTVCARMDQSSQSLVCTEKTAGVDFFRRAAYLFGLDRIEVKFDNRSEDLGEWLLNLPAVMLNAANSLEHDDPQIFPLFVSPNVSEVEMRTPGGPARVNDRDSFHAAMCDIIYALKVSDSGNTRRSIERRLATISENPCVVFLSSSTDSVSEKTRDHLVQSGALHYHLVSSDADESDRKFDARKTAPVLSPEKRSSPKILLMDEVLPRVKGWLTHCTRRRIGPWPDEDLATYIDDLLFRRVGANHSALAALCRIVRTARIVSTSDLIRGTEPVVSFSARPFDEILNARTFRSHLSRWDCEPYGVCIARESLVKMEARPVIYAAEDEYKKLSEEDRPFFQKKSDSLSSNQGEVSTDWSEEQEWRKRNDVLLKKIPRENGVVFVPTLPEARFITAFTRFDVCVTES